MATCHTCHFKLFKCFPGKMCKLIQCRHDSDRWWPLLEAHLDCHANHIYSAFHFMSLKVSVHRKSESGLCCLPRLQYAKGCKPDSFSCSWVTLSRQIRVASWKGCLVFKMLQNSMCIWGRSPDEVQARLQHRQFFPLGCNTRLTLVRGGEGIQGAWLFLFKSSLMSFQHVNMESVYFIS